MTSSLGSSPSWNETSGAPALPAVGRDVVVSAGKSGTLAARDIVIQATAWAQIGAPSIDLKAASARLVLDDLLHIARCAVSHMARLRSVVELFEVISDRVFTRLKDATRLVEGTDHIRAGNVDYRPAGTLQLQAETALISADSIVRVDAKQIHMR
ncbi:MAG: DUF3540 domain-containing protein [Acetobacteraceae bacterium]